MPAYHTVHIVNKLIPFSKIFSMPRSLLLTHDFLFMLMAQARYYSVMRNEM